MTKQDKITAVSKNQANESRQQETKTLWKRFYHKIEVTFFGKNEYYQDKIAKRSAIDPEYSSRFAKIHKRYKKIYKHKNKAKKKMDLAQSYTVFAFVLLLLIFALLTINTFVVYRGFWSNIDNQIKFQSGVIEKATTSLMGAVDNYINYVGDKLLTLKGEKNNETIASILRKTLNRDALQKNVSSWISINFVNNEGKVSITSDEGVLKRPIDPKEYFPIREAKQKNAWRLKVGQMTHIETDIASYNMLPVAMRIDYDNLESIGTFIAQVPTEVIQRQIDWVFGEEEICYVVIDNNFDLLAHSENFDVKTYNKSLLRSRSFIYDIFDQSLRNEFLPERFKIDNCVFSHSKKSLGYRIVTLTGYHQTKAWKNLTFQLLTSVGQSAAVAFLFMSTIYLFRRVKIGPFVGELIKARVSAKELRLLKEIQSPKKLWNSNSRICKSSTQSSIFKMENLRMKK